MARSSSESRSKAGKEHKAEVKLAEVEAQKKRLKNLIVLGKDRGYLTYAEINDHLPDDMTDAEQIEGVVTMLADMGIAVYDEAPDAEQLLLNEAAPSVAVRVLGLNGVPDAGLEFSVVEDERDAREVAEQRHLEAKAEGQEERKVTLENLFATLEAAQSKALKLVVKADTQGSVEAIVDALHKIESDKVSLEIIHSDVGAITENDVALASASSGVILGFHTRVDSTAAEKAKREGVQIKLYAIIYELIDQVKEAMAGLLDPVAKDTIVGSAEVRKIFELSKGVPVAGCMVSNGRIVRGKVRIRRRKDIIYEGVTQSLRRFQDEVNEVRAGMECGIRIEGFGDFQVGDAIECYTIEKIAAKL